VSDGTLFDLPDQATTAAPPRAKTGDRWERVTTQRLCDWCKKALAAASGHAARPAQAKWRHTGPAGVTLLCYRHGREIRTGEAGEQG
jgi:hypothetical protein